MNRKMLVLLITCAAIALPALGAPDDKLVLWFQKPAVNPMNEALAIGNGRMGALVFGDPSQERLSINESSLWTGDENPGGNYDTMGAYQVFGNIFIHLLEHGTQTHYR